MTPKAKKINLMMTTQFIIKIKSIAKEKYKQNFELYGGVNKFEIKNQCLKKKVI